MERTRHTPLGSSAKSREVKPALTRKKVPMRRIKRTSFIGSALTFLVGCAPQVLSARSLSTTSPGTTQSGMMQGDMMQGDMMQGGMMNVSGHDMSVYREMFDHHTEIERSVERLPNGVRTTTESSDPRIATLLREHVPSMWEHVNAGEEVRCMSDSLPTMFRNASKYRRHLELTPTGVVVTETSDDPVVLAAIRRHAEEVTGFVKDGMSAMMREMM